ncbi:MAG: hypothetical protein EA412_01430 [Chitinophagaceae bacterium]|nr:MAG: hypothetical protein EA412_01430 [Chitinophagaceae bacterium]
MQIIDFYNFSNAEIRVWLRREPFAEEYMLEYSAFINKWLDKNVQSFVFETSGTTGKPKEITFTREQLANSAKRSADVFNLKEGDLTLLPLPATYVAGRMMMVRAAINKQRVLFVQPDANPLKDLPEEIKISFAPFVPYQLEGILSDPHSTAVFEKIHTVIIGGAPLSEDMTERLSLFKNNIFATFGMTETLTHIALRRIAPETQSLYTLLPQVKIGVNNDNCLKIKDELLDTPWIQTNDIVELSGNQAFNWIARKDNVINSGGIKVFPEIIESALSKKVLFPFFIAGIKDKKLGEKVVFIGKTDNVSRAYLDALQKIFSTSLKKYEQPKEVFLLKEFVYNANKKVDRKATIELIGQ